MLPELFKETLYSLAEQIKGSEISERVRGAFLDLIDLVENENQLVLLSDQFRASIKRAHSELEAQGELFPREGGT